MNLFDVYPVIDIEPVKGEGCYMYDRDGNQYLDLYGGHAVISIGHSHPVYIRRITEQLQQIAFYSNSVVIPQQRQLADMLGRASDCGDYSLFLCNSGAEANENAIKLASFRNGRKKVLSFGRAFHGRTHGTLAVTDNPNISAPVNSRDHVTYVPLNDINAVETALAKGDTCAVIIEGIQGLAGINCPDVAFLQALRSLCDRYGTELILDEVQSGYGRTGKFFAFQYAGIRPDIITTAKGMGNGFPVAGVLIHPKYEARHGMLGTTFGGGYLACAASIAVLEVMQQEALVENALTTGNYLIEQLKDIPQIREVRGRGLMIGMEFAEPIAALRNRLIREYKIFTGASSDKRVLRILPPLTLKPEQADVFADCLKKCLLQAAQTQNRLPEQ
ncbi:MAG: aminotransferase class III-fold pyridoxal phosphate-dependent enzyme [Bacteroidales bacterium]|jgi:acetylornithine aminotransferase|nr:aminotransferase class III-fold pyridoxal phosphate-dependent enzyme [Bacteroidales bacterium]